MMTQQIVKPVEEAIELDLVCTHYWVIEAATGLIILGVGWQ